MMEQPSYQRPRSITVPPVSLGICSRNRPDLLLETVVSVLQADAIPAEIVIIDQSDAEHPTLPTFVPPEGCEVRYIWTAVVGVSPARNRAITEARYDLIVLIDDDMQAEPSWLEDIVAAAVTAGPDSVITGRVLPAPSERSDGFVPSTIEDPDPAVYQGWIDRDVLFTGNMALWRSLVAHVGWFDDRLGPGTPFPAAEDNDFAYRLLRAGSSIVYAPQAVLYHRAWRLHSATNRLYWDYGYGQGAFYAKHLYHERRILRRLVWDVIYNILPFPLRLRRKGMEVLGDIAFGVALVWGAAHWTLKYGWGD